MSFAGKIRAGLDINKGTRLERIRKEAGLSREELAKLADVPRESICAYELGDKDIGKAPYRTVERLAKALGCSIESIVGE